MHPGLSNQVAREFAAGLADRLGDELIRVSLYGSRARGEARLRSDFDLMVVLRRATGDARDAVHRLATKFELEQNVDLSTKILDRERFDQLRESSLPFWRSFARDEKILWPATKPSSERRRPSPGLGRSSRWPGTSSPPGSRPMLSLPPTTPPSTPPRRRCSSRVTKCIPTRA
jgi:predicted nucleotidyltransferase